LITVAKDEDNSHVKTPIDKITHEIFEFADETMGHAEGVPREKLMLACYDKLGTLMAQWAQKLDKIEVKKTEPAWLKEVARTKEQMEGERKLSEDYLMITQPRTMIMEDFKSLIAFCEKNRLDFYVDGFNTYQPGRAFRVVIYRLKEGKKPQNRRDFGEKTLKTLLIFGELSKSSEGKSHSVEKKIIVGEMMNSGKFESEEEALGFLDGLTSSGQIPKSKII